MCLEWIAASIEGSHDSLRLLDFGCGSGILAVSAALLGAQVTAVDYDAQAVVATKENAEYNGVAANLRVLSLDEWQQENDLGEENLGGNDLKEGPGKQFDVIVANILAQPLMQLARDFQASCKVGGSIVLSGILRDQSEDVISAYTQTQLEIHQQQEEWVLLHGLLRG